MRVAYDVTPALVGVTGVARYTRELDAALEARSDVALTRYAIGRTHHDPPPGTRHLRVPLRLVHRSWQLARRPTAEQLVPGAQVVHAVDLLPPPTRLPTVLTVHDLAALDHPHLHSARARHMQRRQAVAARDATIVLAVSAATAEALEVAGVEPARIRVCPHGLTRLPPPQRAAIPSGPYVLAVGSVDARKGTGVLVEALGRMSTPVRLVLAGPERYGAEEVSRLTARLGLDDRVVRTGWVSDAELAWLYHNARLFCFPSAAEGFGLPVLEALDAGTPSVVSDLPVLRQLAGDAAVYVPPGDPTAWGEVLDQLLNDDAQCNELRRRGPTRAEGYTWEKAAAITVAAYREALERAPANSPR